ncbi:MAG: hypothetical protein Q9174_006769, partial [Haloplaca sp. 1 TL-2023]
MGVKRGERIMTFTPNHIFIPVVYLGVCGSLRIISGANPSYTASELAHQIADTKASILLAHPDVISTALTAAQRAGLSKDRVFLFSDDPNTKINGVEDWRSILGDEDAARSYVFQPLPGNQAQKTIATLNYSSGTTGLPKGVAISHLNLCANMAQNLVVRHVEEKGQADQPPERWVGILPLYHAFGQLFICLLALKLNVPVYIMKAFDFNQFLHVIQTYRITNLQVAPPIMVLLAKRPEVSQYDLSSVTNIGCGAAPLSGELENDVSKRLGAQIGQGWGMTELTCSGFSWPTGAVDA